MGEDN